MKTVPEQSLQRFLDRARESGFAVAKNPDLWQSLARGGDWDLVANDVCGLSEVLVSECGPPDALLRRSYVWTHYFAWGQIDLLPNIQWRGLQIVSGAAVVQEAQPVDGIPVARPAHQVAAACIYPLLAHRGFRPRYLELVDRALADDRVETERMFIHCFGEFDEDVARTPAPGNLELQRLRRTFVKQRLRRGPMSAAAGFGAFVRTELAVRWTASQRRDGSRA